MATQLKVIDRSCGNCSTIINRFQAFVLDAKLVKWPSVDGVTLLMDDLPDQTIYDVETADSKITRRVPI